MEETKPKSLVFVLMPFSEDFLDTYEVGIKPACKDAGAYCERVDEQMFVESILERIYDQIAKADIIVADMTGRNPNVFYEVGYAHALNKQVILLTKHADDIPFDLTHYPHIVYEGRIAFLKSKLESRIRWCIENPKSPPTNSKVKLEIQLDGVPITEKPEIRLSWDNLFQVRRFRIDIHNASNSLIRPTDISLALVTPADFDAKMIDIYKYSKLPNGQLIFNLDWKEPIFPDSWTFLNFVMRLHELKVLGQKFEVVLRLFAEFGYNDYPFVLSLEAV